MQRPLCFSNWLFSSSNSNFISSPSAFSFIGGKMGNILTSVAKVFLSDSQPPESLTQPISSQLANERAIHCVFLRAPRLCCLRWFILFHFRPTGRVFTSTCVNSRRDPFFIHLKSDITAEVSGDRPHCFSLSTHSGSAGCRWA